MALRMKGRARGEGGVSIGGRRARGEDGERSEGRGRRWLRGRNEGIRAKDERKDERRGKVRGKG